jgi:serine/threonine protein kinase/Flp pilus assembly protein TadD
MGLNLLRLFKPTNPDKLLGGRYKIINQLGAGGFGQTFLAQDLHLPGHPQCVVKQLKPQVSDAKSLQTARRLFDVEAKVLYQLGNHDQIPRLLAHFEDDQEFYLAQELIEGELLTKELRGGEPWPEDRVIALLQDILHVLAFVHQQNVIHRDIKPSNLIRRRQDGRIVLIDFGAVKEASTPLGLPKSGHTKTISIGTQGYTPKEQLGGNPRFSSDIYAVGVIGIQALTGIHPRRLSEDPETGEINWGEHARQVSSGLAAFLDQMVRYDFRVRYPTATQALEALRSLPTAHRESVPLPQPLSEAAVVLPSQELQPPDSATGSTGSGTDVSSTNIWVPTESPVALQPTEATGSGTEVSSTNIWVPPEPPVETPPTAIPPGSMEPLGQSQRSQQSASSAPTIATPGGSQRQSVKPWFVLAALLAVGATVVTAKPFLFPQPATKTADRNGEPAASPTANSVEKPALLSPASPSAETPSPSPTKNPALPSPSSQSAISPTTSPAETPSATPTKNPTPPSPVTRSTATQAPPASAPPPAKPAPAPARTPATSAPPRPEPQVGELLSEADRLREAGQYQKAVELYDRAIANLPDVAEAQWGRCYSLNRLQQFGEAIAACNKALALKPNYPEALWSKGAALEQQQNPLEALKLYERATALKPDFADAWINQGVALQKLNRPQEALAALDKAIALKPDSADAWTTKGAAFWELGRYDQAIAAMDKALEIQPDNQNAINLRQQAREKLGR